MIYGMHDPFPKDLMPKGWILLPEGIGHDPNNHNGRDYREWSGHGVEVIVRLSNGYGSAGTIPSQEHYLGFAERCAWFVRNSQGCTRWIIGNEPNHSNEWPQGNPILARDYVHCFTVCRDLIKAMAPTHEVIPAPVAPWNVQVGDWLAYFDRLMAMDIDAIALHTYTHGAEPGLITSEATMDPPYQDRRFHFRAYQDFMNRIPESKRHLPVYITETDQDDAWLNWNTGWVKKAYKEIDDWNHSGRQVIHCLCLYRWPKLDKWAIDGKSGVQDDFREAQAFGYQVGEPEPPTPPEPPEPPVPPGGGDMAQIIIREGFEEGGHYDYNGIRELTCPKGLPHELAEGFWIPQWWEGNMQTPQHGLKYFNRPELDMKYQTREVKTGNYAWYVQSQNKVHNACLYRRYRVKPGDLIKASVYIMIVGAKGNGHGMRIGIDPTGGTEFLADSVLYGDYYSTWADDYSPGELDWVYQQTPQVTAQGDFVTVFLHSENVSYDTDTHGHWDDHMLIIDRAEEPEPPEPPIPPEPPEPPMTGSYVVIKQEGTWPCMIRLETGTVADTGSEGVVAFQEPSGNSVVVALDSLSYARLEV